MASVAISLTILLTPLLWSLGSALGDPGLGTSVPGRFAEWARSHGAASIVTWAESEWYSHHPPPVGGRPRRGAIPAPRSSKSASVSASTVAQLASPAAIAPIASPPVAGEGQWHPAGRPVDGVPAVYEAYLRPDAVHTSVVVGVAWMDTKLLRATLDSGSTIPGGGPWQNTAPVTAQAADTLVAAFNSGFRMSDANGGYYTEGTTVVPLRQGAASFVIYSDGTATVGQWGRDVSMTPNVVAVRQNLDLLVDGGNPVPGLNANDTAQWGYTLGSQVYVWRSGVGVTADGALVYVGGPDLNITDLADVLVRAGAVRAMELDINTDWVNFASYSPASPTGLASPANGTDLLSNMAGAPDRYFEPWWSRDFITMSARPTPRP
ncbi:MAG: phosphodiester glycosidase family protein [Acidimicrobiales bacterium]